MTVINAHTIGSDIIAPKYPKAGVSTNAATAYHISSTILLDMGTAFFPMPCRELLVILSTASMG